MPPPARSVFPGLRPWPTSTTSRPVQCRHLPPCRTPAFLSLHQGLSSPSQLLLLQHRGTSVPTTLPSPSSPGHLPRLHDFVYPPCSDRELDTCPFRCSDSLYEPLWDSAVFVQFGADHYLHLSPFKSDSITALLLTSGAAKCRYRRLVTGLSCPNIPCTCLTSPHTAYTRCAASRRKS